MSRRAMNNTYGAQGFPDAISPMTHLRYLKGIHHIMGRLSLLWSLVCVTFGAGWMSVVEVQPLAAMWACLAVCGPIVAVLFFMAGNILERGKGRILATLLIVMYLSSPPGIVVAIYTLWVCWFNEETKAIFDRSES